MTPAELTEAIKRKSRRKRARKTMGGKIRQLRCDLYEMHMAWFWSALGDVGVVANRQEMVDGFVRLLLAELRR